MKKNLLVTLGICAGLMLTACPKADEPDNGKTEPPVVEPNVVDVRITTLLGENHNVPKIPEAEDWAASIINTTQGMAVSAYCTNVNDEQGRSLEEVFAATLTADSHWNALNDDTYTVDDYGYMFGDGASQEASSVLITFYLSVQHEGEFDLYVIDAAGTYDGKPIDEDGNEVEWYVDYIGYGFIYETEAVPSAEDLNAVLGTDVEAFPMGFVPESGYVYAGFEADEQYNATFVVIYPGGEVETAAQAAALEEAGYEVRVYQEIVDYDFDMTTWEITYIYQTYYFVLDADYSFCALIYADADYGLVEFDICTVDAYYGIELTEDTEWSKDVADFFADLGISIPFVALGADYAVSDQYFENYGCYSIEDGYYLDLTEDIKAAVVAAGFVLDEDPDSDTYGGYLKDLNEIDYIAISVYYSTVAGNTIDIYPMEHPHITYDTEWNEEVAEAIAEIFTEDYDVTLPFVALGNEYGLSFTWLMEGYYAIVDYYDVDLTADIIAAIETAGFVYDADWDAYYYENDDGSEFEIYVTYDTQFGEGNTIVFNYYPAVVVLEVGEALALPELAESGSATEEPVYVGGTVVAVGEFNESKGYYKNVVIEDEAGNRLTIRTINLGEEFADSTIEVGDVLIAYGYLQNTDGTITMGTYNNTYAYVADIIPGSLVALQ